MNKGERFIDSVTGLLDAKRTEILFNMVLAIVGTGLTLLMTVWLVHQVRMMWGL